MGEAKRQRGTNGARSAGHGRGCCRMARAERLAAARRRDWIADDAQSRPSAMARRLQLSTQIQRARVFQTPSAYFWHGRIPVGSPLYQQEARQKSRASEPRGKEGGKTDDAENRYYYYRHHEYNYQLPSYSTLLIQVSIFLWKHYVPSTRSLDQLEDNAPSLGQLPLCFIRHIPRMGPHEPADEMRVLARHELAR